MVKKWLAGILVGGGMIMFGTGNAMAQHGHHHHHGAGPSARAYQQARLQQAWGNQARYGNYNRNYYGGYGYNAYRPYYVPAVPAVVYRSGPVIDGFYGSGYTAPLGYRTGFSTSVPFDGFYGSGFGNSRSGISIGIGF